MGRIKTILIKRVTKKLMESNGSDFSKDFYKNKEMVNSLVKTRSKKMINVIAGYATRLVKKEGQEKKKRPALMDEGVY